MLTKGGSRRVLPGRHRTRSADPPCPPFARWAVRKSPPAEPIARGEFERRASPAFVPSWKSGRVGSLSAGSLVLVRQCLLGEREVRHGTEQVGSRHLAGGQGQLL